MGTKVDEVAVGLADDSGSGHIYYGVLYCILAILGINRVILE